MQTISKTCLQAVAEEKSTKLIFTAAQTFGAVVSELDASVSREEAVARLKARSPPTFGAEPIDVS